MAPFSIPAPIITLYQKHVFGGPKSIDTVTKIQLSCETFLDHEIFYTLDGTKPQPYAGIVQGSKLMKYHSPFCLPAGKITVKAIAINANVHTMRSSIVTRCFEVLKADSGKDQQQRKATVKPKKKPRPKKKSGAISEDETGVRDERKSDDEIYRSNSDAMNEEENILHCFDEAFIGGSEFESENSDLEGSIEDEISFRAKHSVDYGSSGELDDQQLCDLGFVGNDQKDSSLSEPTEELRVPKENKEDTLMNDEAVSTDTQFCCLKCDLTLQQCISCSRMNAVSSKFCIGCGKQLSRICGSCTEYNSSVACFCQRCGHKLKSNGIKFDPFPKTDHSVMATPELRNAASQMLPVMIDRTTQTVNNASPVKKSDILRRMPPHSPGRGYWHQQLDYICNHLKTHAYNNIEFRREISDPILCDFKSAHIIKDEDCVTVTVVFSPLKDDKKDLAILQDSKSDNKAEETIQIS